MAPAKALPLPVAMLEAILHPLLRAVKLLQPRTPKLLPRRANNPRLLEVLRLLLDREQSEQTVVAHASSLATLEGFLLMPKASVLLVDLVVSCTMKCLLKAKLISLSRFHSRHDGHVRCAVWKDSRRLAAFFSMFAFFGFLIPYKGFSGGPGVGFFSSLFCVVVHIWLVRISEEGQKVMKQLAKSN
jgi:hypothetical protein